MCSVPRTFGHDCRYILGSINNVPHVLNTARISDVESVLFGERERKMVNAKLVRGIIQHV